MEELSDQVECVISYFGLRRVIGLASGAGANVLARFALNHPEHVQALILANPTSGAAGQLLHPTQVLYRWRGFVMSGLKFTSELKI